MSSQKVSLTSSFVNQCQYTERIDLLLEEGRRDLEQGRYTEFSSEADFEKFFDEIENELESEIA